MRLILPVAAIISLTGCQKDFDDQYAATEQKLKAEAEQLDKQMAEEAAKEANQSDKNR